MHTSTSGARQVLPGVCGAPRGPSGRATKSCGVRTSPAPLRPGFVSSVSGRAVEIRVTPAGTSILKYKLAPKLAALELRVEERL